MTTCAKQHAKAFAESKEYLENRIHIVGTYIKETLLEKGFSPWAIKEKFEYLGDIYDVDLDNGKVTTTHWDEGDCFIGWKLELLDEATWKEAADKAIEEFIADIDALVKEKQDKIEADERKQFENLKQKYGA